MSLVHSLLSVVHAVLSATFALLHLPFCWQTSVVQGLPSSQSLAAVHPPTTWTTQSEGFESRDWDGYEQTSINVPPSLVGEMQHSILVSTVRQAGLSLQTLPPPCEAVKGSL